MKKIAIFTPTIYSYGGESRVVAVIANELSKDFDVTVYTCEKKGFYKNIYGLIDCIHIKHYFPYSKNLISSGLRFYYRKTKSKLIEKHLKLLQFAYYSKSAVKKLQSQIKGVYDIVIAVSGNLTILLGFANENNIGAITIGWEHSSFEAYFETPHIHMWKKERLFINGVKNIDSCVVLNEDIAGKYKKNFSIDCDVIYNPRSFVSNEKSKLNKKQFIACGRFVEAKGFDLLIDSFHIFSKKNKEWKLLLVGDGPLKNELEKKIQNYNLENRIILTGYVTNIKELLLNSSVYLLSSRWEGFPMCVTEAYEVGLPVICYDIPAMIPLMNCNEGIKVQKFNIKEYAEAMLKLAQCVTLRKNMSQNSLEMSDFISIENIGNKWRALFECIIWRKSGEREE